jgi:CPA1 family monovalent cation:H+ antiporter
VWEWVTYTLNGFAFLLIGLELTTVLDAVQDRSTQDLVTWAVAVSVAVIVARVLWVFPGAYLPRILVPSIARNEPALPLRNVLVVGWAGMRGAVSLAAALALPLGFPERDLLIFLAFCVILATLVGQGLTLGPLIRALGIRPDPTAGEEEEARRTSTQAALEELERMRAAWPLHLPLIDRLADQFRHRMEHLTEDGEASEVEQERLEHRAILGSVLKAQRNAVAEMRERGQIDGGVLRAIERELDLEELRLSAEA